MEVFKVRDSVFVEEYKAEGTINKIDEKKRIAEVQMGIMKVKVSLDKIKLQKNMPLNKGKSTKDTKKSIRKDENNKNGLKVIYDYPYNFVSLGDRDSIKRGPYLKGNNSGKLVCRLINKTPIFTTGETEKKPNGHTKEWFLKENGKYIIPSSSLKGEVRNIVEVLTNSCIKNVFEKPLERRKKAGEYDHLFGIIKRLPTKETPGLIIEAEKISINAGLLRSKKPGMYKEKFSSYIYNLKDKIRTKEELRKVQEKEEIEGILWVSSPIYIKFSNSTFLVDERVDSKKRGETLSPKKIIIPKKNGKTLEFSYKEYQDLLYIINQREEREGKNDKSFYLKSLETGEAIIFEKEENLSEVKNLAFSEIPRLRYKCSPLDLVPQEYRPCNDIENLCFACRLFGSTGDQQEKKNNDVDVSCQGKVFFTDATIEKNKASIQHTAVALKPLGEPRASLWRFYLKNADEENGYDTPKAEIRGRKFYWHHTDKLRAGKDIDKYLNTLTFSEKKYNSSLQFMNPENTFNFEVRFNNLTDEELGVLIYSLELENGLLHKLGKAKAFGFGSSKIIIDKFLLDSKDKYKSFTKSYDEGNKEIYLQIAKEKYLKDAKLEIKELKAILNEKNTLDFSKSPFPEVEDKDGNKNTLEWFKKNKNTILGNIRIK